MKLNQNVWHGYTRPAGEVVTLDERGSDSLPKDNHGCNSLWVRDSKGNLMNVWNCEVEEE